MAESVIQFQPRNPLVRTVSNAEIDAAEARHRENQQLSQPDPNQYTGLAGFIRTEWDMMVRHRNTTAGWSDRLLDALRAFNGQYDPQKLAEIRKFGGSEVYARLIAAKCRAASSLLRDVYLGAERPWGLTPPVDPEIPLEIMQSIEKLVETEVQSQMMGAPAVVDPMTQQVAQPAMPGKPPEVDQIRDRVFQLMESARDAAKVHAKDQTVISEEKLDEILSEGNFYSALAEFITDISVFPFACIKGPTVRMVLDVSWQGRKPVQTRKPRLWWDRVSPFDLWWTPGVSSIEDARLIHRIRLTRTDLNDLIGLPGYNTENIRAVLQSYGSQGLTENWDSTDATRAVLESRENPVYNMSNLITTLEFHGNVQGKMLLEYGFTEEEIPDPLRDYAVQAWLIGQYLIKVQMSPSPRRRHPFYLTSFEKIPSTPVGNGIVDIISDLQEVANASLRSLVNNLSISSGPQVVINEDRLAGGENTDELYPWKRWRTTNPLIAGSTEPAISFFQPQSNANEALGVFNAFYGLADDVSAIPKYLSGNSPGGGAGRTASGLAMLMGNASKILQTVCANIDRDVMSPLLRNLLDLVLMTDQSGLLTGEEEVQPKGVVVAVQRETMRQRQLEFLQLTQNPIDLQIMGPKRRANVLRAVSHGIGMDGDDIVPSKEELDEQEKQAKQLAMMQGMPGSAMQPPPPPGAPGQGKPKGQAPPAKPSGAMGPQTNVTPARVAGGVG
jgi:uncharacterized protein (DUF4415 family)